MNGALVQSNMMDTGWSRLCWSKNIMPVRIHKANMTEWDIQSTLNHLIKYDPKPKLLGH
jgi:hypothetical protein